MSRKLEGRVALVTGAGRGIGRSVALKLASEGAQIVVNDLDADPTEAVVAEIRAAGGEAVAFPGSVTAPEFAEHFIQKAVQTYKSVDIIINNAGYTWDNVIQKMQDEQWQAIIDVHLTAPFRILRAAYPVIREMSKAEAEAGRSFHRKVVNVSSVSGTGGNAGQANYSAAKAGIVGLTKTMAKEWGRLKVNVNAVAFGFIRTRLTEATADSGARINIEGREIRVGINPDSAKDIEARIPLLRGGTPDESAGAIYILCIPESNYISGQCIVVGGGAAPG